MVLMAASFIAPFACSCWYLFSKFWLKLETLYDLQSVLLLRSIPGTVACDRNGVVSEEYERNEKNHGFASWNCSEVSLFSLLYCLIQEQAV